MAAEGADLDCQLVIDVGVRVEGSMAATTDQRIVWEHWEIINLDEWGTHDAESWGPIRAAGSDLEVGHELHLHQRPLTALSLKWMEPALYIISSDKKYKRKSKRSTAMHSLVREATSTKIYWISLNGGW